jgi:hypothetical protein
MSNLQPVYLVASGDLRQRANVVCWPAQAELEANLVRALGEHGRHLLRAHPFDDALGHGFISSQRMGMDVFNGIPREAPVIVATAVWQYSHHVLPGLRRHRGPILTVANWSGEWPGLVGLLNLNGSLTKAGVDYDTLWSERFDDPLLVEGLRRWLAGARILHDRSHVRKFTPRGGEDEAVGERVATGLREKMAILGVFDEGCMGMYNAIIDDELLNPLGLYKERLSQSALVAEMQTIGAAEAQAVRDWLDAQGMRFVTGPDPAQHLTDGQILEQARMYIAAVRIAERFGCDAIGIQYQQGLKDMVPASDLVEGLLNDPHRPPVRDHHGAMIRDGEAIPHFNEVDEGAAVDALVTNRVWRELGFEPSTTLHDLRWGEELVVDGMPVFAWVLEISGAVPASHLVGGYAGATGYRQPPMYFPLGGSTLAGVSKPGEIVWSRIYIKGGSLHADLGLGRALALPAAEVTRRRAATTPEWPIMNAELYGVTRDQMMAQHQANHIQVAYVPDAAGGVRALRAKAAAFAALGMRVQLCGAPMA